MSGADLDSEGKVERCATSLDLVLILILKKNVYKQRIQVRPTHKVPYQLDKFNNLHEEAPKQERNRKRKLMTALTEV